MHDNFDCDDVHMELGNLAEDFAPIVSSILMPSQPSTLQNIPVPNELDEEIEIACEALKAQLIMNKKIWVFHFRLFFQ